MKKRVFVVWAFLIAGLVLEFQACNKAANPGFAAHPCSSMSYMGVGAAATTAALPGCAVIVSPYTITGTVDFFQVEAYSMVGTFNVGLYSNNGAAPGSLITTSGNVTGAGIGQGQTIAINPVELTPGTYWLAFGSQSAVTVGVNVGTTVVIGSGCGTNALPGTFSASTTSTGEVLSLRADYCQ